MVSKMSNIKEKIKYNSIFQFLKKIAGKIPSKNGSLANFLSGLEEKFHFPISQYFWHFVTACGILVGVAGLLLVLWGLTPVFTRSVDEPEMLKERTITAEEVKECAFNMKPWQKSVAKKTKTVRKTTNAPVVEEEAEEEERLPPNVSLKKLQEAIPSMQLAKKGRKLICDRSEGYYEYGDFGDWIYPSRCYEYGDIDTRVAENIRTSLQSFYPYDSLQQQNMIDGMASRMRSYQEDSRQKIFNTSMSWFAKSEDIPGLWDLWAVVDKTIGNAGNPDKIHDVADVFSQFADFMLNNPKSGKTVLLKALEVIEVASGKDRLESFKIARKSYKDFNLNVGEWTKATSQFVGMKELHNASDFLYNLKCFYEIYKNEQEERLATNERRMEEFNAEKEAAEFEAEMRKTAKRALIPTGGIMVGIAFGVFIVISILLVLFSMQRTLVRLENSVRELKNSDSANK